MDVWRAMISAQGGDPDAPLATAKHREDVTASNDGVVSRLDALGVGIAAWRLGAGRASLADVIQPGAGIYLHKQQGDAVRAGEAIMTLYTDDEARFARAHQALDEACGGSGAVEVAASAPERRIVLDRVDPA